MAWKTSARIKSPKGTRRDLWVGFKPNGIGETKPNHYKEMLKTIWDNRDNLPYAWRILNQGVCDGCALGVAGFHDWTLSGVHLCTTRLNLLRVNTMGALDRRVPGRRRAAAAAEGQGAPRPRAPRPPDGPAAGRAGIHPRDAGTRRSTCSPTGSAPRPRSDSRCT